jgi:photosystem II stability/assembly factor-like uncharacterized protein
MRNHPVLKNWFWCAFLFFLPFVGMGQKKTAAAAAQPAPKKEHYLEKTALAGLKWRGIGPALTSGRISDFAVHPQRKSTYYVAVASGGVWKTENNGTTFQPLFDSQGSYSIGCITLDPSNPNVVWVGTGENNNQRSVAYGDGVYKSEDGGASWKNMGLKTSEHIGKIIVDPRNSDVVYVAAIGPLWNSGGERGVYKTTDGGKTWTAVLTIDPYTGVNDLIMDPRNPEVLYASSFQRERHVFTYVGGGQGSSIYRTKDGGKTWEKAEKGLPSADKGRIGLAISPANPEYLYAIVEAAQGQSGFFRSLDRGATWEKRSSFATSGNYYQEIVAHPSNPDIVYSMDTYLQWTTDGGKTFEMVGEQYKHVDNHCMWIDPDDTDHYLVGCDGGIYESFDAAKTWNFKPNLSVTQFYKVAVDNTLPFYYVYGGTQDNFSLGGPSRNRSGNGIVNSDWVVTQGGDGFESQIDPNNPNIVYAQSQHGGLVRYDRATGEQMGIQPQPRQGEEEYRWNWDAPLAVSSHAPQRIYFAANKLFRSDDRGDTWEVISPDLTRQLDRNALEVMGRVQSIDAVAKNGSTSQYGNIVAFSESPINPSLLFVGTDDGLIQITSDGGQTWSKIDVNTLPGAPQRTYVNFLLASQHNENVVYAAFNHHKYGDFKPYVYVSKDRGKSWTSISGNLPERGSVYSLAEDHVEPMLLFAGTEFGCFFTLEQGAYWKKLGAGLPTIAVRDMAIQKRENDLVLATFGRGFYVLDDYSALRQLKEPQLATPGQLFPVKDGLLYHQSFPLGLRENSFMGHNYFSASNPPVGAVFTYFIKEKPKTRREVRQEMEKEKIKKGEPVSYPTYEELTAEQNEEAPYLLFTIKDQRGAVIRQLRAGIQAGVQRIVWDGRYPFLQPVSLSRPAFDNPFANPDWGIMAMPGEYTVTMTQSVDGKMQDLAGPVTFRLLSLGGVTLPAEDRAALVSFQKEAADFQRITSAAGSALNEAGNRLRHIREAVFAASVPAAGLVAEWQKLNNQIAELRKAMYGDQIAGRLDKGTLMSPIARVNTLAYDMWNSSSAPTKTQRDGLRIAKEEFGPIQTKLRQLMETDLPAYEQKLEDAGAPYTPGRKIKF